MSDDENNSLRNRKGGGGYDDDEDIQYSTEQDIQKDNKANIFVRKFIAKFDTDKFNNHISNVF